MSSSVVPDTEWITDKNADIKIVDIVDRTVISERLGVTKQAIGKWAIDRDRTGFPKPIFGVDGVRRRNHGNSPCIYYWPDIHVWHEQWKKLKPVGGKPYHAKVNNEDSKQSSDTVEVAY